jgi:hypothetical protein
VNDGCDEHPDCAGYVFAHGNAYEADDELYIAGGVYVMLLGLYTTPPGEYDTDASDCGDITNDDDKEKFSINISVCVDVAYIISRHNSARHNNILCNKR